MKMFLVVCVLALAACASARNWEDTKDYTFAEYCKDFSKDYEFEEFQNRMDIFTQNLAMITRHNAGDHSWKMGINKFVDMTPEEIAGYRGVRKGLFGAVKPTLTETQVPVGALPDSMDWRSKGAVSPVKDQGGCGSCWAFAATETIESHLQIATGQLLKLSPQDMVSCTKNPQHCGGTGGCSGATCELGFDYVRQAGIALEKDWPYHGTTGTCKDPQIPKAATVTGFVKNPENNYTALISALATKGPQAITVDAGAWAFYSSGVFDGCSRDNVDLDHGVQLVGYGTENGKDYWIVRNSWGNYWGESGYIRLLRHSDGDQKWCGVDKNPADGTGCTGGPSQVTACGTCGIWYDTSYPTGAALVNKTEVPVKEFRMIE
jgi:cathepsin L